jgi:transposase
MSMTIGVDVAKAEVVVAEASGAFGTCRIGNRKHDLVGWLRSLPAGSRLGLESTGGYHVLLADLAYAHGLTVYLLNPKDVHHYAEGLGRRAKTDRVDAELIARYVKREHDELHPYVPAAPEMRVLAQLQQRRYCVIRTKGALESSAEGLADCRREYQAVIRRLEVLIAALDKRIARRIEQMPDVLATQQRLIGIIGIGPVVSRGLAPVLCRIPFSSADAFVAYVGLDPRPRDSGQKAGRRRLSKRGPSLLRWLLFNAALGATRSAVWQPIYQRYRARGLSGTAALNVIARKLARIAWSLHHHRTEFDPKMLTAAEAA